MESEYDTTKESRTGRNTNSGVLIPGITRNSPLPPRDGPHRGRMAFRIAGSGPVMIPSIASVFRAIADYQEAGWETHQIGDTFYAKNPEDVTLLLSKCSNGWKALRVSHIPDNGPAKKANGEKHMSKLNLDGAATTLLHPFVIGATLLALHSREAHWNVKGPNFGPLHELFGDFYDFINDWADTFAERIVQQGGVATTINGNYDGRPLIGDEKTLLGAISTEANALAEITHTVIPQVGDDETTKDALIEFGRELEKWIWKIESHLQEFAPVGAQTEVPENLGPTDSSKFAAIVTERAIIVKSASGHAYKFDENIMPLSPAKNAAEQIEAATWLQQNFDSIFKEE